MSLEPDKVVAAISESAAEYAEEAVEGALAELDRAADEIIERIRGTAPRGDSAEHLADSFAKTEQGSGLGKAIYISSRTKGRLVHLIELGFRHRSGKHVAARPFMRPAHDAVAPGMLERIKRILEGKG